MNDEARRIEDLFDEAEEVGREALELLLELKPALEDEYDDRQMLRVREDLAHHVRQLASIALFQEGAVLIDYLSWLKVLFDGLGIPDDHATLAFRCVGRAGARRLEPAAAKAFQALADRAAREYGRSEPATNRWLKEALPDRGLARAYVQALIEGRSDLAESIIVSERRRGTPLRGIYLELFQPAQREVGRLWQLGKIDVAQEHYATAATQYLMSTLYPELFAGRKSNGRRLLAACSQGELHELGLRMVADFFQAEGWDTRYMGANLPVQALLAEIGRSKPDLIALSATVLTSLPWTVRAIAAIQALGPTPPPVIVGGSPFNLLPDLWREVGADGSAADCEAAIGLSARLLGLGLGDAQGRPLL